MTAFIQLNVPVMVLNKKAMKFTCSQSVCISCLQQNVSFVHLSTCKHANFLEFIFKFKEEYQSSVICQKCHHFLKKIELFKLQVQESLTILNSQAHINKPSRKILHDLRISNTESADIILKNEPSEQETCANPPQERYSEITTEVKVEHESYSDLEIDAPLSEIKKEMRKVKKKEVSKEIVQFKKGSLSEKYEGKIAVVTLSKKEMLEERERDAKKDSYLKLPYKCDSCITGFDHDLTLKDHIEKRHGTKKGGYRCEICKTVLATEHTLKEHTKRHFTRYVCQECGKRKNNVYSVIKHYNETHGTIDTHHVCKDCGFTTESNRSYRYHRDKHKQKLQCSLCESTFVNNNGLRVHMLLHEGPLLREECPICHKMVRVTQLKYHIQRHQNKKRYECTECNKIFLHLDTYQNHLKYSRAHVSDSVFQFPCSICNKGYPSKQAMQDHFNYQHLGKTSHKCPICGKALATRRCLARHVRSHEGVKEIARDKICQHCGKAFRDKKTLREHEFIHTGERPLSCEICGCTFRQSASLYTHKKRVHKIFPSKKNVTLLENVT